MACLASPTAGFKGGYTTRHYGRPSAGVHAIQMELACRGYMADPPEPPTPETWPAPYDADRAAPMRGALTTGPPRLPRLRQGPRMTRLDNTRLIRSPHGRSLTAKSWLTEAPLRMLMNNLDPDVAERPEELVVYGGIGRAARDWGEFRQDRRRAAASGSRRDLAGAIGENRSVCFALTPTRRGC